MSTVRFTSRLGVLEHPDAAHFAPDAVVEPGMVGELEGPHPNDQLAAKGWQLARVELEGRTFYVPVVEGDHFEPIANGGAVR